MDTNKSNQHVINIRIYFPSEKKIKIYVTIYNTYCRTLYIYSIFLIKIEIVYIVNIECQSVRIVGVPRSRFDVSEFWWLTFGLWLHWLGIRRHDVDFWWCNFECLNISHSQKITEKNLHRRIIPNTAVNLHMYKWGLKTLL